MPNFFGLRSVADFATGQVPERWLEMILREFPNGDAPLTALISRGKNVKIDNPTFNWFSKTLPTQRGSILKTAGAAVGAPGVYIDATLKTLYVYATHQATYGIAGATVFVNISADDVKNFLVGHIVLLRNDARADQDIRGRVTSRIADGTHSYIGVKLLQADTQSAAATTNNLATATTVLVIGSAFAEGAERPESIVQDTVSCANYTQIFRTAVEMTRTAYLTKLRTGDPLKEARRDALEQHSIELEKAWIWGVKSSGVGLNGKPLRTTMGIIEFIQTYAPSNVLDYTIDSNYTAKTWLQGGDAWLDASMEQIFRYGRDTKLGLCGSKALLAINQLAKANGYIQLNPASNSYGLEIKEWLTPFGILMLKRHPLFSYEATNSNSILIVEPEEMTYNYMTDTVFKEDTDFMKGGDDGKDAIEEEYLTEAGLEIHFPNRHAILNGVGKANSLSA